jgi:Na+:H+ antiporter, NhaA family
MQGQSKKTSLRPSLLPLRLRKFLEMESAGGVVMLLCAVLALVMANFSSSLYQGFINAPVTLGTATGSFKDWVKDILMVFFFLMVGLELKREVCEGFLSKWDQVILPLLAAIGGMVLPAVIFLVINHNSPGTIHGWAIPSATDIAFALAILMVLGKDIPPAIKIFLLTVAIFDDCLAVLIIAVFYNTSLSLIPLLFAFGCIMLLVLLNRTHVMSIVPYVLLGILLWLCFYYSGIHTTLAGIIVGLAIPMRGSSFTSYSPINRSIQVLHPWVSFMILPLFAFTNAGVDIKGFSLATAFEPLPLGIALGLFMGKQIGIFATSWLAIKSKLIRMPSGTQWRHFYAVSVIAGIGFTMSLFIGMLAFPDAVLQDKVKVGVLMGSLLCILWGGLVLRVSLAYTHRR